MIEHIEICLPIPKMDAPYYIISAIVVIFSFDSEPVSPNVYAQCNLFK